jgi:predicted metalloprotease
MNRSATRRCTTGVLTATALSVVLTACGGGADLSVRAASGSDGESAIDQMSAAAPAAVGEQPASGLRSDQGGQLQQGAGATMYDFEEAVLLQVDGFWSQVFTSAGLPQPTVSYQFPGPGESVPDACSSTGYSQPMEAAYCATDDTITVTQDVAVALWEGTDKSNGDPSSPDPAGDFSVAFAIAHEYAHSLQAELGLIPTTAGGDRSYPVYKTELHADCWAGVWANSAYYDGSLEPGDVEEAIRTAMDLGDYEFEDPGHHGTPEQRSDAFMTGFDSGVPSDCDVWLTSDYS